MQDNSSFAYHVNKNTPVLDRKPESVLISVERAQKLDLLIHLITNLQQSLVVCGPKGIGKTTVLNELVEQKSSQWQILQIKGTAHLSFESFQEQLKHFLYSQHSTPSAKDVNELLAEASKNETTQLIIIDDAGEMVPGLITHLIHYVSNFNCLRLIFALTLDELHIKISSDRTIENCHFIEIPPLTDKQCGIFLQNQSRLPNATFSFNAIDDRLIEKLYRETHGIPGRIVQEIPNMNRYTPISHVKWLGLAGGGLFAVLLISHFVGGDSKNKEQSEGVRKLLVKPVAEDVAITSPVIESPMIESNSDLGLESIDQAELEPDAELSETVLELPDEIALNAGQTEETIVEKPVEVESEPVSASLLPEKQAIEVEKKEAPEKTQTPSKPEPPSKIPTVRTVTADDDSGWLRAQSSQHFTIQLIALTSSSSVKKFYRDNPILANQLKTLQINKGGKTKFVIIYGSFANADLARKSMRTLPSKYRKSWVRAFDALKQEIK